MSAVATTVSERKKCAADLVYWWEKKFTAATPVNSQNDRVFGASRNADVAIPCDLFDNVNISVIPWWFLLASIVNTFLVKDCCLISERSVVDTGGFFSTLQKPWWTSSKGRMFHPSSLGCGPKQPRLKSCELRCLGCPSAAGVRCTTTGHSASMTAAMTSGVVVSLALYSSTVDILSTLSE